MSDTPWWMDKVAVVTGATSGIGRSAALALGADGMRVVATGRNDKRLAALKDELTSMGAKCFTVQADFASEADVMAVFETVREQWGGTDVLINNAGLGWRDPLSQGKTADWRQMLDVNVLAMTICMREAVQDMTAKGFGQVINISSIAAYQVNGSQQTSMYAATKHAVRALTDGMRGELVEAGSPLKIGMISPGRVETEWHGRAFRDEAQGQALYEEMRPLTGEDIVSIIRFMLNTPPHMQINDVIVRPVDQRH